MDRVRGRRVRAGAPGRQPEPEISRQQARPGLVDRGQAARLESGGRGKTGFPEPRLRAKGQVQGGCHAAPGKAPAADQTGKAAPDKVAGGDQAGKAAPVTRPGPSGKSTISLGAAGLWEHEARERAETPSDAEGGTKGQEAKEESWAYKYLVPPLWKPDGHPEKEWAKAVLKEELTGFAESVLAVPDTMVDSVRAYDQWRKRKGR